DIDWECPGQADVTTSFDAANDTPNFLRLLQALRTSIGPSKFISAAVHENQLFFVDHAADRNLSAFAAVLDWVSPKVYNNFGPWDKTTAHDAPM
ncbi:glycoside hydrolase superfamily, partial [Blyttiomyces helicus]